MNLALIVPENTPPHSVRETPIGIDIFVLDIRILILSAGTRQCGLQPASLPAPREHAFEAMERDAEEHDEQGGPPQTDRSKDLRDSR
jgi:hypothetical protein